MSKYLKILYAILIGVMSLSLTACGGDDDEPNDPTMPESGTWKIAEYENLSMRLDGGSVDRDHWSFWENEFKKEIEERKIKINKNTHIEDGWYVLSKDDERDKIGYLHDLERIKVLNVEGKTMMADYFLKQYLSVQSDDDYVIFRATIKLKR